MKSWIKVILFSVVSLGIFWWPFIGKIDQLMGINFGNRGMETIVQNFDGLNFLVVAKSWYNPQVIEHINSQFLTGNDPIYFTAHFPLFAGIIRGLGLILPLPQALLAAIVVGNVLLAIGLYWLFTTIFQKQSLAMVLAVIVLFFPARMLSVRAVGSNEPLFIFLILCSLIFSIKNKYLPSAVAGALAVLTRAPGILLFGAYVWQLFVLDEKWSVKLRKFAPYLLMPLGLLGLFVFYGFQYHDPFAYFHSGDNLHIFAQPFQIFSNTQSWISDMWREDVIYLYVFYGLGLAMINDQWSMVKKFGILYGVTLLFVAHRDLARYALPLAPMAIIGYAPLIERVPKKAWWGVAIILIPIYLLGWQFILKNIQPINNWGVFY